MTEPMIGLLIILGGWIVVWIAHWIAETRVEMNHLRWLLQRERDKVQALEELTGCTVEYGPDQEETLTVEEPEPCEVLARFRVKQRG